MKRSANCISSSKYRLASVTTFSKEMEAAQERSHQPQAPATVSRPLDIQKIHKWHNEAYLYIDNAITLEENQQLEQALVQYQKGLTLIEKAMEIQCNGTGCSGEMWEKASRMQQKMRASRKEVLSRIIDIQCSQHSRQESLPMRPPPPPSYDEYLQSLHFDQMPAAASQPGEAPPDYDTLNDTLMEIADEVNASVAPLDGEKIFEIPDNVQIFFVSPEGNVSAPSYPSSLRIYRFTESATGSEQRPPAFLQIGSWTYPLVPGQSPVLHSQSGTYMFPDLQSQIPGATVGVIIPQEISESEKSILEDLFYELTALVQEPSSPKEKDWSTKVAESLVTGAEYLSKGMVKGAEKATELLSTGTSQVIRSIQPEAKPVIIDPKTQRNLQVARNIGGGAVKVSGFIVSSIGKATMGLGRFLAPHIQKHGTRLLAQATESDEKQSSQKVDKVLEVASGALVGFGTVYLGLENSAKILASSIGNNTVQVISHKYGDDAGKFASNAVQTAGFAAMTAYNINALGVKGIAKRTAKDTGKAVLEDFEKRKKDKNSDQNSKSSNADSDRTGSNT